MRQIILAISLLLIFTESTYGQIRTIQGKVMSEDFELLPTVRIQNIDTVLLGKTDLRGNFDIEVPLGTEELLLSWIGMEWTIIQVPKKCDTLEVVMMSDVIYDFMSPRKIDRLRKKRFDDLPEIHLKAYQKGIFNTATPCHSRAFKPIRPALESIEKQMKLKRAQIKETFKALSIGDTIQIPYSGSYRHDGTDRTSLFVYSYVVEDTGFDCLIEGVITDKNKRNKGYNLCYRIISLGKCSYDSIIYEGNELNKGDSISHNMKYYKVLVTK